MPRENQANQPLSPEQREAIYLIIHEHMLGDDRDPQEVIREDFAGDEDMYLRSMAAWFGLKLWGTTVINCGPVLRHPL